MIILASGLQLEGGSSEKEGKSEPSFGKRRIHDLSLYMNVTGSMNEGYILIFVNIILLIFKEPVLTTFIFQLNININVYIIYIYHWMNFPIIHLFFFLLNWNLVQMQYAFLVWMKYLLLAATKIISGVIGNVY